MSLSEGLVGRAEQIIIHFAMHGAARSAALKSPSSKYRGVIGAHTCISSQILFFCSRANSWLLSSSSNIFGGNARAGALPYDGGDRWVERGVLPLVGCTIEQLPRQRLAGHSPVHGSSVSGGDVVVFMAKKVLLHIVCLCLHRFLCAYGQEM